MGGGTFRAASKLAGIAATTGPIRGIAAERFPVSAARKASSVFPAAKTAEDVNLVAEAGVQRPCSGIDDWVFAGGEKDDLPSAGEPLPRVVFGGVPSLQEAKEATSELTVALENAYLLSPNPVGCKSSVGSDNDCIMSLTNKKEDEIKACVSSDVAVPAPAIMAFRFLHENPMAQNVVASIACDSNVWNAVLQNNELQDFLQSQRGCSLSEGTLNVKLVDGSDFPDCSSTKSTGEAPGPGGGFTDFLQRIKSTVIDMMNSLSDYFTSFFGGKGVSGVFVNADGTAKLNGETVMEASFMGLAVMAILVILLKRA
ncbi:hypothetical protein STAS_34284 [Striga asiatica]|uniref:Uncharacterized protein n=1 Tax=Striga asiatica TaxID=4170 RepID=A0A5A7RHA2_STRAF|nr:hypothetical protein STAS_34284 [Striga asiatica]